MLQAPQTMRKQLQSCKQQQELKPVFKANFRKLLISAPVLNKLITCNSQSNCRCSMAKSICT